VIKWFKKKFNEDKYEIVTSDVPMSTICRWYLYDTDITDNTNDLAEMIGLSPISEEGESKELQDSEKRIQHMSPLFPYLEAISDISSDALSALHIKELIKSLPEDEKEKVGPELEQMGTVYKAVALSTLIGAFSIALDLGIISHNTVSAGLLEPGDDND
jgi:hypothetical protein